MITPLRTPKDTYEEYRGAMAYIEVVDRAGNHSIGSAFHIGEGVFVTARHVVEGLTIKSMATTEEFLVPDKQGNVHINGQEGRFKSILPKKLKIKDGPLYHPEKQIDVALVITEETDLKLIPPSPYHDDWVSDQGFILAPTVVMGYPPIPFSKEPKLFVASGEINAIVDKYTGGHVHFVISTMPRGGFSGGVCIAGNMALWVIVESLVNDNKDTELGYMSVLSMEPILTCLKEHKTIPNYEKLFGVDKELLKPKRNLFPISLWKTSSNKPK